MIQILLSVLSVLSLSGCSMSDDPSAVSPAKPEPVRAAELPSAAYLRKLSYHLKGENPSADEYVALERAANSSAVERFMSGKINEYLASPQHVEKMGARVNALLLLRGPAQLAHWPKREPAPLPLDLERLQPEFSDFMMKNSLNFMVQEIVRGNQSWDNLLLNRKFRVYNYLKYSLGESRNNTDDAGLFRRVYAGPLPPSRRVFTRDPSLPTDKESEFIDLGFPSDFPQAAGVLTTARFFDRYVTTQLNKNRRRAAAVYRIFLCDDMVPVAAASSEGTDEILKLVFPKKTVPANGSAPPALDSASDAHGANAACIRCHAKLDPVGLAFSTSPFVLSSRPVNGVLNTETLGGQAVSESFTGLSGLARSVVAQERYSACQVQHFWNWFIGEDRPLDDSHRRELMAAFDRVGRRTNDFIAHLVQTAEFKEISPAGRDATVDELGTLVRPLLKRCDTCHSNHPNEDIPPFSEFPIGGSPVSMARYAGKISKALDLENGGVGADMPPSEARWQLTQDDRALLFRWIGKVRAGTKP